MLDLIFPATMLVLFDLLDSLAPTTWLLVLLELLAPTPEVLVLFGLYFFFTCSTFSWCNTMEAMLHFVMPIPLQL